MREALRSRNIPAVKAFKEVKSDDAKILQIRHHW
jgi:hypothetical protein